MVISIWVMTIASFCSVFVIRLWCVLQQVRCILALSAQPHVFVFLRFPFVVFASCGAHDVPYWVCLRSLRAFHQ